MSETPKPSHPHPNGAPPRSADPLDPGAGDPPGTCWFVEWVARSILHHPRHARLLAASLLDETPPGPAPSAPPAPARPPTSPGSEYHIG